MVAHFYALLISLSPRCLMLTLTCKSIILFAGVESVYEWKGEVSIILRFLLRGCGICYAVVEMVIPSCPKSLGLVGKFMSLPLHLWTDTNWFGRVAYNQNKGVSSSSFNRACEGKSWIWVSAWAVSCYQNMCMICYNWENVSTLELVLHWIWCMKIVKTGYGR